jgi:3'-phosphoadenosine 5'-phosphosulfate sulfotransferase (PAPS reductase)/FAD synthetase
MTADQPNKGITMHDAIATIKSWIEDTIRGSLIFSTFSGGKDSVATWLHLERELGLRVKCVFADTGWESEWDAANTYRYIDTLEREHGLPLIRVEPKVRHIWKRKPPKRFQAVANERLTMARLIEIKKRPPSATARFCTSILKLAPIAELVANTPEPYIMASGVRAQESKKREAMSPWAWDELMGAWRWLPIQQWTVEDVFAIHKKYGVPVNPLYLKGCSRVGCWPCIFAQKSEIAVLSKDFAGVARLKQVEADSGQTFFAEGKVAREYRSKIDPKTGVEINTADDVLRWAVGAEPNYKDGTLYVGENGDLEFAEDDVGDSCSSVYGLCE